MSSSLNFPGFSALGSGGGGGLGAGGFSLSEYSSSPPSEPTLPDWLPTNANAFNSELQAQYNRPNKGLFGAKKAGQAIDQMQQFNMSMGMSAANNAAQDYATRVMQQGGTAFNAGAVKAQALMPVLQQNAALGLEKQDRLTQARMKAADMKANLAGAINNSRLNYLSTLAGTYTTMRGQNITDQGQKAALAFSRLGGGGSGGAGAGAGAGGGANIYSPGYISNAGPITEGTKNGVPIRNTALVGFGGPGTGMGIPFRTQK